MNEKLNPNRLVRWIREILSWLAEGKIVVMFVLIPVSTVFFIISMSYSEISIIISGLLLQILGMIFTIKGLFGIRAYFKEPLLLDLFIKWLNKFPKLKNNYTIHAGAGRITASVSLKATGEVWSPDNKGQSIDKRIEYIYRNFERIRNRLVEHDKSIENIIEIQKLYKKTVAEEKKKMEDKFQSDLKSLHTSDLIPSLVGLIWLMIGITMSTLAPELAGWLKILTRK